MSNHPQIIQGVYCTIDPSKGNSQNSLPVPREIAIIVCSSSAFVRQDAQTLQDSLTDISERACEYLSVHHNFDSPQSSLKSLANADATSLPHETFMMAYVFDKPSQKLFGFLRTPSPDAKYSDGFALSRFLNTSIWAHIAGIRTARPEIKIILGSGPTQMPLEEFKGAIKHLVGGGGVKAYVSAMGDTERSRFWNLLVQQEASIDAKAQYTYATTPLSDIDFEQLTPRYVPHVDSDVSDSTEEGAHENN